ncbi:hypothetical protein ACWC0C_23765 [Streptomyces sp. NPDC001709]
MSTRNLKLPASVGASPPLSMSAGHAGEDKGEGDEHGTGRHHEADVPFSSGVLLSSGLLRQLPVHADHVERGGGHGDTREDYGVGIGADGAAPSRLTRRAKVAVRLPRPITG